MRDYQDNLGLIHDKPVLSGKRPSSNNGWIYTAYAKHLKPHLVNVLLLQKTFTLTYSTAPKGYLWYIPRRPNRATPPISRDELIGMISLGVMDRFNYEKFFNEDWSWYREDGLPETGLIDWLKAAYRLYKHRDDRNYVWREKDLHGFKIAFKATPHDRYYYKKMLNIKTNLLEWLFFQLYAFITVIKKGTGKGDLSAKNVLWLQLKDLNSSYWIKKLDHEQNFQKYFRPGHVLTEE